MKTLALALMLAAVPAAHAQARDSIYTNRNAGAVRLFSAVGGAAVGTFVGGFLGYNALPRDCGCDDPGLDHLIYGAFAGIAVGSALSASFPDLQSVCDFKTRFRKSIIGSSVGSLAGFLLSGKRSASALFVVPVSGIGGSLATLGKCWKSSRSRS
jgi:hypothetical protein